MGDGRQEHLSEGWLRGRTPRGGLERGRAQVQCPDPLNRGAWVSAG